MIMPGTKARPVTGDRCHLYGDADRIEKCDDAGCNFRAAPGRMPCTGGARLCRGH
jgi:hypothetical protein